MFGKTVKLFSLFGFDVKIDASWLFIAVLVSWSLASGFFPYYFPRLPKSTYWTLGVLGSLGLFASILFHEFWHSFTARGYGMPMHGITLFLFGGVSEMHEEPPSPKIEFVVAVVGPLSSVVLGFIFAGLEKLLAGAGWAPQYTGIFKYLALINWVVAGFNMIPAFPLDGGRILRAAIWKWKGDLKEATRMASAAGGVFGFGLIFLGVVSVLTGNVVGGIWYVIVGLFLRGSAQMSYKQLLLKQALSGDTVEKHMTRDPVTAPPDISVRELVDRYFYRHNFKMFPVMLDGRLMGCVHVKQIKDLDPGEWENVKVGDLASHCSEDNTVAPGADVMDALTKMRRTGNSRLLVVDEKGALKGVIALKDLMSYLSRRMDLED